MQREKTCPRFYTAEQHSNLGCLCRESEALPLSHYTTPSANNILLPILYFIYILFNIARGLVSSKLDYCNFLLYNTANKDVAKLQRVQIILARVVMRSPRYSHSAPLLKSFHWIPVHYHIVLKICTIAYQALSSTQPAYLNSMLTPARNSRQLRSTSSNPFYIPWVKTGT